LLIATGPHREVILKWPARVTRVVIGCVVLDVVIRDPAWPEGVEFVVPNVIFSKRAAPIGGCSWMWPPIEPPVEPAPPSSLAPEGATL
jgi:hypothetical protein